MTTSFNKRAADICATFKLGAAVKRAAAEQSWETMERNARDLARLRFEEEERADAFARMTKAANDRGAE